MGAPEMVVGLERWLEQAGCRASESINIEKRGCGGRRSPFKAPNKGKKPLMFF